MRSPEQVLSQSKVIAVVGLTPDQSRPAYGVARYLQGQGYVVIPVNPTGEAVLGQQGYRSLSEVPEPIDIVDVFRRPDAVVPIAKEAVAVGAGAFWLQLGIVNEEAARIAREGGLDVVMDKCTKVVHQGMARTAAGQGRNG
jgi:predicted CoA-binding protein